MKKEQIIGWFGLILGIFHLIGSNFFGPVSLLVAIGWFYVFYRGGIKKENFSKGMWITIGFLIFIGLVLPILLDYWSYTYIKSKIQ